MTAQIAEHNADLERQFYRFVTFAAEVDIITMQRCDDDFIKDLAVQQLALKQAGNLAEEFPNPQGKAAYVKSLGAATPQDQRDDDEDSGSSDSSSSSSESSDTDDARKKASQQSSGTPRINKAAQDRSNKVVSKRSKGRRKETARQFGDLVDSQGRIGQADAAAHVTENLHAHELERTAQLYEQLESHAAAESQGHEDVALAKQFTEVELDKMLRARDAYNNCSKPFVPEHLTQDFEFQREVVKTHVDQLVLAVLHNPHVELQVMALVWTGTLQQLLDANTNPNATHINVPVVPPEYIAELVDRGVPYSAMAGKMMVMGGQHGWLAQLQARRQDDKVAVAKETLMGTVKCIPVVSGDLKRAACPPACTQACTSRLQAQLSNC